jgi:hypothetical protein
MKRRRPLSEAEIRRRYRAILGRRRLSNAQIDRMRAHVRLLAQAICEHVWGKKVY